MRTRCKSHKVRTEQRPTPRQDIYDLYWLFAARRQAAFLRRAGGLPWPWSDDPILQKYKFCNVYRAADRVSQYLIRNVICGDGCGSPCDQLFQIVAFRTFSRIETWEAVVNRLGVAPTLEHLISGQFEAALDAVKAERGGLYTGAFILCATKAFGFEEKHKNHCALFRHMFLEHDVATKILESSSLETLVQLLASFPLTGPFMSYQIAIDLNYSDLVNFGENDYTQAGPGAMRGIKKAFVDLGTYTPEDVIAAMVEKQDSEFARMGLEFGGLWGRRLHAIDCQGLFCELDKYCREAAPQLLSNRTRIKARFNPSPMPISYFFPPKWGINDRVDCTDGPATPVNMADIELRLI
jgi:hypothetical protein